MTKLSDRRLLVALSALPGVVGIVGAFGLVLSSGATSPAWPAAVGLTGLLASLSSAWLMRERLAAEARAAVVLEPTLPAAGIQGLDRLCIDVLPIWSRQVETASSQTEEAITSLTERFSGIHQRLEAVSDITFF